MLIPPPLIFLLVFFIGFWLERRSAWPIRVGTRRALAVAGLVVIGLAITLGVSAVATFRRRGTTILPARRPTRAIVAEGPYRITRNPMYVSMAIAYIGGALLLNSIWPLLLLPVVLVIIDRYVITREERYLRGKFGEPYEAYMRRVRRWL